MAVYTNDLRLKEITTGDESGTWGTSTNTNLSLIAEALSFATEAVFDSDADKTTTVADGATDPARALYYKVTGSVHFICHKNFDDSTKHNIKSHVHRERYHRISIYKHISR